MESVMKWLMGAMPPHPPPENLWARTVPGQPSLDQTADVVAPRSEDPKLIIRVMNFELVQPIRPRYINVTDRRTDGQMDRRTTYDSNTALALRASRGKNAAMKLEVETN